MDDEDDLETDALPSSAGNGGASVPVLRRLVTWDPDGNPVVETKTMYTKASLNDVYMVAASQPYEPDPHDPKDAQYLGLSCAEVMVRKQILFAARTGNAEAVMDRLLGRPKQSVESTKLVLTYEDTLKDIARREALKSVAATVIDAQVVGGSDIFG